MPAFSILAGKNVNLPELSVPLKDSYKKAEGLTHFLKGYYDGQTVELLGGQESYKLNSFAKANCLVEVPEQTTELVSNDRLKIYLFS
jgi:molybdopterin molybdotransferase